MTKRKGPGELYDAENRESLGPYVETVTHGADGDSREGKRERDAAHRAPENTRTCNTTTAGQQGMKRMKEGGSKESGAGKKEEDEFSQPSDRRIPAHNDGQASGPGKRGPESLAKQLKDGKAQEQGEGEDNTGNDERREATTDLDDYGASRASNTTDYSDHGAREDTTDHDDYGASGGGANDHDAGRANPDKKAEEDKRDTGGSGKRQEDDAPGRM